MLPEVYTQNMHSSNIKENANSLQKEDKLSIKQPDPLPQRIKTESNEVSIYNHQFKGNAEKNPQKYM